MAAASLSLLSCLLVFAVSAEKERVADGGIVSRIQRHHGEHNVDAEAIVGSRKEADAVGQLPAEEARKRLRAVAKRMDDDKDGQITEKELTDWIVKSIRSVDEEETEERMREMDTNGDGKISWKEYVADVFPHEKEEELDADDRKLMAEDKKYFEAADKDRDESLSKDELAAFITPEHYEYMHDTLVELTMSEKDEDKDGAISLAEYLGEVASNEKSEWHQAEKERFHKEYDKDEDGKLTGHEITAWLIPSPRETAQLEAKHLFAKADADRDGSLSYEEVAEQYELFVSSEATRYGEHLDDIRHKRTVASQAALLVLSLLYLPPTSRRSPQ